jgi:hypothetical protein
MPELVGISFQIIDKFADGFGRHFRIDDQHIRLIGDHRNRKNILLTVVTELLLVDMRQDEQRAGRHHRQRVAVRLGIRHRRNADAATGAALVLDHELLAEPRRQAFGKDPRRRIDIAAGRERHDDGDRPRRPLLRHRGNGADRQTSHRCNKGSSRQSKLFHVFSPQHVLFVEVDGVDRVMDEPCSMRGLDASI